MLEPTSTMRLWQACVNGDTDGIERFFAQESVMQDAMEVESWFAEDAEELWDWDTRYLSIDIHVALFGYDTSVLRVWWYVSGARCMTLSDSRIALPESTLQWFFGSGSSFATAAPKTLAFVMFHVLCDAVNKGHSRVAESLLTSAVFTEGLTPAKRASLLKAIAQQLITCHSSEIVDLMLSHGVPIEEVDLDPPQYSTGNLMSLARNGAAVVGLCVRATPMCRVLWHYMSVKYLTDFLTLGGDARASSDWIKIVKRSDAEYCLEMLLYEGFVDVDQRDDCSTALIAATSVLHASDKQLNMVQMLLRLGANTDLRDNRGQTAVSWAAKNGSELILRALVDHNADVHMADRDGRTPLHHACYCIMGDPAEAIVRLLLDHGADPNAPDITGQTSLHYAVRNDAESAARIVQQLLDSGANPNEVDRMGCTPIQEASKYNCITILDLLFSHGGEPLSIVDRGHQVDQVDNDSGTTIENHERKRQRTG